MKKEFKSIPILKWGNDITLKGVIMEDSNGNDYLVYLPSEKENEDQIVVNPSTQEWYELQDQLDHCDIEGEEGKILRKGQRQLDQKICWQVFKRDNYKCRYCGIDNVPLTVDHIKTWETGGATHKDNLLTSCRKCNKKRGNLDYGSWLQHEYCLHKSQFISQSVQAANEAIIFKLKNMPAMAKPRKR